MMNRKNRLCRLIEFYINDRDNSPIQEFYGKGTRVKIDKIYYSTHQKSIMVEAVIILGELIAEELLDRSLVDILVQDSLVYFYPEESVKIYVRWDA